VDGTTPELDVVVIGAGVAGLACAVPLCRAGLRVRVYEAGQSVGGRVRTDEVDGYRLDRGFQVLAPAYPALDRILDLDELDPRPFSRGVGVLLDGRVRRVLADPVHAPASVFSGLVPLGDALALAGLSVRATVGPVQQVKRRLDRTTMAELRTWGLSPTIIERVLRPLLSGMFLEDQLDTSARYFLLAWRTLLRGGVVLPAGGAQRLPELLAAQLPAGTVHCGVSVAATGDGSVTLASGERLTARAVVVATDATTASALLPGLPARRWHGVTTYYHATLELGEAPTTLLLDPEDGLLANSAAVTAVTAERAPPGYHLVASSVLGVPDDVAAVEERVRRRLPLLYGVGGWEFLRAYPIRQALPAMRAPHPLRRPVRLGDGRYVCGDHRDTSSIQGALVSGRRAARAVLADLGVSVPIG